jgi:hypothetical protein
VKDWESLASGGIFVAIGCIYGITAITTLPLGSAFSMGPGYFPLVLSGLLAVLGAAIMLRGLGRQAILGFGPVPWRAIVMISLAILAFAFFIRALGLFPTALVTTLLTCLARGDAGPRRALALSVVMALICTLIFSFGIGLPVPIFGPWLRGWI